MTMHWTQRVLDLFQCFPCLLLYPFCHSESGVTGEQSMRAVNPGYVHEDLSPLSSSALRWPICEPGSHSISWESVLPSLTSSRWILPFPGFLEELEMLAVSTPSLLCWNACALHSEAFCTKQKHRTPCGHVGREALLYSLPWWRGPNHTRVTKTLLSPLLWQIGQLRPISCKHIFLCCEFLILENALIFSLLNITIPTLYSFILSFLLVSFSSLFSPSCLLVIFIYWGAVDRKNCKIFRMNFVVTWYMYTLWKNTPKLINISTASYIYLFCLVRTF